MIPVTNDSAPSSTQAGDEPDEPGAYFEVEEHPAGADTGIHRYGAQGGHVNPLALGLFLAALPTHLHIVYTQCLHLRVHLHTVYISVCTSILYSECLPTLVNTLAERACSSQARRPSSRTRRGSS
jgi:hypothetical protein